MATQKLKLTTEEVIPQPILEENREALDLYKETAEILKETNEILEATDIALGRKKVYTYVPCSTKNIEINHDKISLTTKSYKI